MNDLFKRKPDNSRPIHRPTYTPGPFKALALGIIFYAVLFGMLGWLP